MSRTELPKSVGYIIARKPRTSHGDEQHEYIVVDRGLGHLHPFVSASCSPHSLSHGEWYLGHYFKTRAEAMQHFNGR